MSGGALEYPTDKYRWIPSSPFRERLKEQNTADTERSEGLHQTFLPSTNTERSIAENAKPTISDTSGAMRARSRRLFRGARVGEGTKRKSEKKYTTIDLI